MDMFTIYDGVSDVDGEFSSEFRRYIQDEKQLCYYTTDKLSSRIWLFYKEPLWDSAGSPYHDPLIEFLMLALASTPCGLFNFWKAEEVTSVGEKRFILTTRNQPFLISKVYSKELANEKIYKYRMKMVDIVTRDAGEGGVVGRVFWNNRMEFTPNIGYYSYEEYPHRVLALSCNIKGSLVLPFTDSSGRLTGVVEIVSPFDLLGFEIPELQHWSGLRYFDFWKDMRPQYNLEWGRFRIAISEIKEVMKAVGRSLDLVCAQAWMFSKNCQSLSTSKRINYKADASYGCDSRTINFIEVEYECILKKAEGVVGKALASVHNLVYCEDVSQFCITEYPLAHYARKCRLTSSFAICLRSDLTGNQIYILEFFLNTNEFNRSDLRAFFPILENMRQNFRTFKVASGEEIGDNISVLVIDARSPDKIATLRNREFDSSSAVGINNICPPYYWSHSTGESSKHETHDLMRGVEFYFCDTSMEESPVSTSTVQSELLITVNANYRGDFLIFQLSSSSGIHELSQQVFRRLNLEIGTYIITYLDVDNDWILVLCDDDLHQYILSSIEKEQYTLMIKIEPIEEF